jgi:hypothetical protein
VERVVLQKIAKVMSQRYDCPVRFLMVDDEQNPFPNQEDQDIINVVVRNRASEIVISRHGVLMPIKDRGALDSIAIFQTSENWLPNRMEQVRFQLDMVMSGIQKIPESNIVRTADSVIREELPSHLAPILIEAPATAPTREFALELHDLAERQFFLALSDLDPRTLRSRQDFKDLGAMTLYIADISKVTLPMQKLIAELIEAEGDSLEIKFIAVCHTDIHSMVQVGLIDSRFADTICGGFLRWPAKLESSGSIHEVLEKLLSRPDASGHPRLRLIRSELH